MELGETKTKMKASIRAIPAATDGRIMLRVEPDIFQLSIAPLRLDLPLWVRKICTQVNEYAYHCRNSVLPLLMHRLSTHSGYLYMTKG